MRKILSLLLTTILFFGLSACTNTQPSQESSETSSITNSSISTNESSDVSSIASSEYALPISDLMIQVSSGNLHAIFRLYDTAASEGLYAQLPLELSVTNFANAQWMFYPPEELPVTDAEIYHDGKKGELSYYEPWGDVFMLYEDFISGDSMHRLGFCISGIDEIEGMSNRITVEAYIDDNSQEPGGDEEMENMQIQIMANDISVVYELNDSKAAKDLYTQLPMTIKVENFGSNEKIFYPPNELDISDAPIASGGAGVLAYYAPWGDVVMFYAGFNTNSSLYELGHAVSGTSDISRLSGNITIEAI